ncbi:type I restriction endonuclease subunit M [Candidatus Poribacteria bacterium]|nr:MAG: type I restriction endonuclease subunit M [Candidatus Poribacteria bacterium]
MITKSNFKDLLKTLGFTTEGNTFQKSIGDAELKVDFGKKEIIYPEDQGLKVHERQTCNFLQNENFVVFECVHRLLNKGYKPEHLELEKPYRIGHSASGGRFDILVKDHQENPLLIIECKTAGEQFEDAWEGTREDGGQLFSYVHQEADTKYLCLYASSFINNELDYEYKLIPHFDNKQILAEDTTLMSFEKANKAEQRFAVWRDTYNLESTEVGIFEDSIQPYLIGKNNYTLAEYTKPIETADKGSRHLEFQKILRQHNIARREQAFEVLVNLFLCKLVDEEENRDNLKFYWNGPAFDNYFDFVDRLQNLYHRGMRKFLNEEISYISREKIDEAFWPVKNDRNATKKQIQEYFTELKFFSNSAFSFLDTHNKDLFDRNTAVLSEVVQMWQGVRLKTDGQNQFLGDMFEVFLDDGIKQSEGQFFTPIPICKFIVSSLPLAQKIDANPEPLKVIDYACGSGHFLNEYAYQIKQIDENDKINRKIDLNDYYANITGIEKEDRLAKVAKVAAYMHGQEQIKILDADALASHSEISPKSFDVLVANPPFAVERFLKTLSEADKNEYKLIQATGENSNSDTIECFFLERIHHLMAPGGVIGVIVPRSILSNIDKVFTSTREILLQFFDIVSIAELGSGTFGKTGTNTVVLFLRRKAKTPEPSEHYRNRVEDFFEGDGQVQYQDKNLIEAYCNHIDVSYEEYIKLFAQTHLEPLSNLLEYDIFKDYRQDFDQSTEIKNLKKSKRFKEKTGIEQSAELEQRLIKYLHRIEKDKLYYFILAHEQTGKVLIVTAPNTNKERKQFLGYEWSSAKGREGIKYEGGETVNDIITPLFDPKDPDNNAKINTAIKRNFIGETTDSLSEHCQYAKLTDMLILDRVVFDKIIILNPQQNTDIETRWPLVKLGDEIETIETGNRPKGGVENISSGAWSLGGEHIHPTNGRVDLSTPKYVSLDFYDGSTRGILQENDILLCKDGALTGKIALLRNELNNEKAMVNEHVFLLRCESQLKQYYIFNFLFSENGQNLLKQNITGSAQGGLNSTNLKEIKIPFPETQIQQKIVDECKAVDHETDEARQTITAAKQQIEEKLQTVVSASSEIKKLGDITDIKSGGTPSRKNNVYWENGLIPWLRSEVCKETHISENIDYECITEEGLNNSSAKWLTSNTTLIALVGATKGKTAFLTFEATTNQNIAGIKSLSKNILDIYIFYCLKSLYKRIIQDLSQYDMLNLTEIKNIRIPVPPLNIQQQLAAEVEQLETEITEAQAVIDKATERKNAILTQYL